MTIPPITLRRRVERVTLTAPRSRVRVGDSLVVVATALDRPGVAIIGEPVVWSSSDAAIASVTASGVVRGLRAGTVTISAVSVADSTKRASLTLPVPPAFAIRNWAGTRAFTTGQGDVLAQEIRGIWATSPTNAWLATGASGIMHFDGTTLRRLTPELVTRWNDVSGTSASDVWFVGSGGTIARFDGNQVTQTPGVVPAELLGVWAATPSDVFVVGIQGRILRWNGSTWSAMQSGTTQTLNAVWGRSTTEVYAVGEGGTILHFNGTAWAPMASGTQSRLRGVWAPPGGDVFAVGDSGTVRRLLPNGPWAAENVGSQQNFYDLHGTSASDIWLVGGGLNAITFGAPQLRFDGSAWRGTFGAWVISVWAFGPAAAFWGSVLRRIAMAGQRRPGHNACCSADPARGRDRLTQRGLRRWRNAYRQPLRRNVVGAGPIRCRGWERVLRRVGR